MRSVLTRFNRYGVVIMALLLAVALYHLVKDLASAQWFSSDWRGRTADVLSRHAWWALGISAFFWLLVLSGIIHERRVMAGVARARGGTMDILDRLTNRKAIEDRLSQPAEPLIVDAEKLTKLLKAKVIGQDQVCEDVAAQIRRRAALSKRTKPIAVFLFAGPPGTGKTYLGKCLAKALERKLVHLDMAQMSRHASAGTMLFGSTKGYIGSETYGSLTASLRDIPDAVVLLDEFEKAHSDIHKNFLTAWNDGFITEASDGRQIATTKAIFILTTNAATERLTELTELYANEPEKLRASSLSALQEARFAPEVLSRIDRIFVFRPLKGLDVARVAALEIEEMIKGYDLTIADGGIDPEILLETVAKLQKMGNMGSSRDLVRAIEERIADSLIEARQRNVGCVRLELRGDDVLAVAADPPNEDEKSSGA